MNYSFWVVLIIEMLLCLMIGLKLLLKQRWLWVWLRASVGLALLSISVFLGLLGWDYFSYHPQGSTQRLGTIAFQRVDEHHYAATVSLPHQLPTEYRLVGDLWRIHSTEIVWRGAFAQAGFKNSSRPVRLNSRFAGAAEARHSVASRTLIYPSPVHAADVFKQLSYIFPSIQVNEGIAAYLPMVHGALYEIVLVDGKIKTNPLSLPTEERFTDPAAQTSTEGA